MGITQPRHLFAEKYGYEHDDITVLIDKQGSEQPTRAAIVSRPLDIILCVCLQRVLRHFSCQRLVSSFEMLVRATNFSSSVSHMRLMSTSIIPLKIRHD